MGSVLVPDTALGPVATVLNFDAVTTTLIGLSSLGLQVDVGDPLAFRLTITRGSYGIRTAIFSDLYGGGAYFVGTTFTDGDAAFKTFIDPVAITVGIDIKPGNGPNIIDCRHNGVIPVAILSTSRAVGESVNFDAAGLDPSTVAFGSDAAAAVHPGARIEDVDGDGDMDMTLRFRQRETGIQCGDVEACLTGQSVDGTMIEGCDMIRTRRPPPRSRLSRAPSR